MAAPLVSVVVPVYNVEKYLVQCLDSLKKQTLREIEIICVNDGSTDRSLEILQQQTAADPRFAVISQENGGYGKAVNAGLRRACGEYISIVESDDWAEPDFLQTLYDEASLHGADIARADYYLHAQGKDTPARNIPAKLEGRTLCPRRDQDCFFTDFAIWSAIYKRDFLVTNNLWLHETPGASFQDVSFAFRTWALAKKACLISRPLLHYRTDNAGSSVKNPSKVFCICDEFEFIEEFLEEHPPLKQTLTGIKNRLKVQCYEWNAKRLSNSLAKKFWSSIGTEAKKLFKTEPMSWESFTWRTRLRFWLAAYHPGLLAAWWSWRKEK